ncbi:MAG TPA: hypothetical protein VFW07_06995 [Parafilimonas sp.]|nr:hypothetical protein [Parafilimonas sp.]
MKNIFITIVVAAFFAGNLFCNKPIADINEEEPESGTVAYLIEKGQHFCTPNPYVTTTDSQLNFIAVFDSSCIYMTVDPANQDDINKLFGFSDCNTQHLENSARIGWRWSKDSLRIFGFVHNNGNMIYKEITTATIRENINCNITCEESNYKFTVNGKSITLQRSCPGNYNRYKLYPYFGGNEPAPHNVIIKLTEL